MSMFGDVSTLFGAKKAEPPAAPAKKVLIVEDEKNLGDSLETKMKEYGYTVLRAANGREGLELASQEHPDVVILDLIMPVMDGNTMLHEIRKIPDLKALPVIVLTNAGTIENIRETKTYDGASEFLIKTNVTLEDVVVRVQQFLAG